MSTYSDDDFEDSYGQESWDMEDESMASQPAAAAAAPIRAPTPPAVPSPRNSLTGVRVPSPRNALPKPAAAQPQPRQQCRRSPTPDFAPDNGGVSSNSYNSSKQTPRGIRGKRSGIPLATSTYAAPSSSASAPSPGSGASSKPRRGNRPSVFNFDDEAFETDEQTAARLAEARQARGPGAKRLTMDELRESMMAALTRQGAIGSLRAQLRARMLSALKPAAVASGMLSPTAKGPVELSAARRLSTLGHPTGSIPLRLRVVESLIADSCVINA